MKIINSIKKSVVLASVGIASLVGLTRCGDDCGCGPKKDVKKSYAKEYGYLNRYDKNPKFSTSDTINAVLPDTIISLEGRIVEVQPSSVSYSVPDRSPSHSFEYVFVNDTSGNTHLFIYPYSKGIKDGQAKINYRPLTYGKIDSKLFIKAFAAEEVNDYYVNSIQLEAEGVIIGEITKDVKPSETMPDRYAKKDSTITKKGITYTKNNNSIFK